MMTIFHATFSLQSIIHQGIAAEMAGHVKLAGAKQWASEAEILAHAAILQARGFEVLPACHDHDEKGHCRGHPSGSDSGSST